MAPRSTDEDVRAAELRVIDVVGHMMEFWGFKRAMGRVWTLLYLAEEPLTAAEIGERLEMSAGAVSMTLSELTKWGAVRKTWRPGDRRDFYECETSIWKNVTRVMRQRELVMVREAHDTFGSAMQVAQKARSKHTAERLGQLMFLADVGLRLLEAIVSGEAVDPKPLQEASARLKGVK